MVKVVLSWAEPQQSKAEDTDLTELKFDKIAKSATNGTGSDTKANDSRAARSKLAIEHQQ